KPMSRQRIAEQLSNETSDGLIAVSRDGRVLWWSRGAELLLGYTADETLGRVLDELIVPPEALEDAQSWLTQAWEIGNAAFASVRSRKDRSLVDLDITMRRIDGLENDAYM